MPTKTNPLKLNPLQLKTLTLFQRLATFSDTASAGPGRGEFTIQRFPNPHGDHFHMGDAMVKAKDATGLQNEAVWNALTRKGLARAEWPHAIVLTEEGVVYDTGMAQEIFYRDKH
jgi:hypothetical protein